VPRNKRGGFAFKHRVDEELKKQNLQVQAPAGVTKGRQMKGNASSIDNPFKMQVDIVPGTRASVVDRRENIESFRRVLASRGLRGIIGLAQQLQIADFEKTGEIQLHDFVQVIQGFNVPISNADIRSLFGIFDRNKKGKINYIEFMTGIKGEMNAHRKAVAELAFKHLDTNNKGAITIKDLLGRYCAKNHPLVRSGKRTEEQGLTEFIETFEMSKSLYGRGDDMTVTKEEFMDYYNSVSASVESNKDFEDIVVNTWRLYNEEAKTAEALPKRRVTASQSAPFGTSEEPTDYSTALRPKKGQSTQSTQPAGVKLPQTKGHTMQFTLRPAERQFVNQFREMLVSKGLKGMLSLQISFKLIDKDGSKQITFSELIKTLKEHRLKYDEINAESLFKIFDKGHSGKISYEDLLNTTIVYPKANHREK